MSDIDYNGPAGGAIGAAVVATAVAVSAFWLALVAAVWTKFVEPRIKRDQEHCEKQLASANERILQLEALLWFHGPQLLRQDMQKSLSEQHLELIRLTREKPVE